jgi:antirestriction protein ArdC
MLIALQKPNASHVAGFRTWNQLGRYVKKGEKGIVILAPMLRRKEEQNEEPTESASAVTGFRAAYVFDITQTGGKELPAIGIVQGDPKDYTVQLQAFAKAQGISLEYSDQIAPARGVSYGGKVVLLPGQTPAEEFSTLTHELAHLCGDGIYVAH